ncbi:D-alanyl-D-alanine carboxypeptidase/D-alanyl-D-alanine-endopeptidase [Chitinophagaceae bacterium LWZ2-11]
MKTIFLSIGLIYLSFFSQAQSIKEKLSTAVQELQADSNTKHASLSLYIINSQTGEVVFDLNSQLGLAPASCQKIITSVAALDVLGAKYRYKTEFGYKGGIKDGSLLGKVIIKASGDPTLGSWRYSTTKPDTILYALGKAFNEKKIKVSALSLAQDSSMFETQAIPGGWIWDDIGNYYGAGAHGFNWKENQKDVHLKSGDSIGDKVIITDSGFLTDALNELTTGSKTSDDNAYYYHKLGGLYALDNGDPAALRGTIPASQKNFTISIAVVNPLRDFKENVKKYFALSGENVIEAAVVSASNPAIDFAPFPFQSIYTYYSPTLDSINYWFLKRSINLYGEALLKTMALEKTGLGSSENGIKFLKNYWQERGIDKSELHIMDGCGLSPQNRITTDALVKALQYAKTKDWFPAFYNALPIYNGMNLKSGSIGGARSFAGYYKSKNGTEYTLAVIINNYDGSSGEAVKKLYKVLDVLK